MAQRWGEHTRTVPEGGFSDGATVFDHPEYAARVVIREPGRAERELLLAAGEYEVGRNSNADIKLVHDSVSRRHCVLIVSTDEVRVRNLSSHGTFVSEQRIEGDTVLPPGLELGLGQCRIGVELLATPAHLMAGPSSPESRPLDEEFAAPEDSFLSAFDPSQTEELLRTAVQIELGPDQALVIEGLPADRLYLVLEGELELRHSDTGRAVGLVARPACIDLAAVLEGATWAATALCPDRAVVLAIDGDALRRVLDAAPETREVVRRRAFWPGAETLSNYAREYGLSTREIGAVLLALEQRRVLPGDDIITEGQVPEGLYVVNDGTVEGLKEIDGTLVHVSMLGAGAMFAGADALRALPLPVTYRAMSDIDLLILRREVIEDLKHSIGDLDAFVNAHSGGDFEAEGEPEEEPLIDADAEDPDTPMIEVFQKGKSKPPRRPKQVWVQQHDQMDCGAACMSMMARAYGRHISLAAYRSLIHVTREGASMWSLVKAARHTGFDVVGVQVGVKGLRDVYLPAVALLQYHFVLIYQVTDTYVLLGDPAIGLRRISIDEFKRQWSGAVLLMRPTERLYKYPETASGTRKYGLLMQGMWLNLGEVLGAALLFFLLSLFTPILTQVTFDKVLVDGKTSLLNMLVLAMAIAALFSQSLGVLRNYLTGYIANRFDTVFSSLTYRHVMKLPLNFFMVRRVGDILTRFQEIMKIRQFLTGDTVSLIIQLLSVALYLGALTLYSTKLGALAVGIVPLFALTSVIIARRLKKAYEREFVITAASRGYVVEQMRALESLKAMNAELPSRWRWETALRDAIGTRFRVEKMHILAYTLSTAIEELATTFILYVAARMALRGEITVGKVIASGQFLAGIFGPIRDLAGRWNKLQETQVSFERVDDIITCAPEPNEAKLGVRHPQLHGDIEFRNVFFQYGSDLSPWVLKDVSLTIRAGETVAVVGRSGSGKTTLVQMINLLYRPTRGSIWIDGKDTQTLPLDQVRGSVGMVMQDSQLFAGTIFQNITLGAENPSLELAIAAGRVANAHGFVSRLPGAYSAELSEGGTGLSGGQRQRLNIARALYRRPPILVLDEATSSLDSESEQAVVSAMKVFCKGRTSIVIAHRLSTIMHADRVVMMDQGRIVEVGPHRELLRKGGAYARLFGAQLSL